jgi:acyl-CoA reductase-like NAD-dependent aldehyde dehydrogenase
VLLELGGNSPHVILDDADMDLAVNTAVSENFSIKARSAWRSTA